MSPKRIRLGKNVFKHLEFLRRLSSARTAKRRQAILKDINASQIQLLVEICYNILRGNFILSKRQKLRILPFAPFVRAIAKTRSERSANNIVQRGAGLISFGAFLAPIIIEALRQLKNGK
jgi:hypothetical protein